ncbi:MAG: CinA family protein [Paracoccaceae bacterium]
MTERSELAARLIGLCRRRGWMLATAESCTGGLLSGALTEIAGASKVFDRGFVVYSNRSKTELLGVEPDTIDAHGAVSEEVARQMAEGALRGSRAALTLSVTGVAGPGASDAKPEGRVCFAVAGVGMATGTSRHDFGPLGRTRVREVSVITALQLGINAAES